jgi:hypothetical protein
MSADIPTNEPDALRAGDTWKWTRSLDDYPASSGWTLKYRAKNASTGFEIVASASGADHAVSVAASTTANITAGSYTWIAWVEGGTSEKYEVDSGTWTVKPDYRAGLATVALDDRSHARKALAAIEAFIESNDLSAAQFNLGDRQIKNIPIPELIKLRQRYLQEVATEDAKAALARGEGVGKRIQFRM